MKNLEEISQASVELLRIPLTYINLLAIGLTFSEVESGIKMIVYGTAIAASIYSIIKTRKEIKKLNEKEDI